MISSTYIVNYLGVSGMVLVICELIHTFPEEIRLMWPAPMSVPKVLFFGLRYYMVAHMCITAYYGLRLGQPPDECSRWFLPMATSTVALMVGAEAILFLRVYAFAGRNKKFMVFLIVHFLVLHIPAFVLISKFIASMEYSPIPIPNLPCMATGAANTFISGVFAILLVSVISIMLMMMYLAFRKHRNFNSILLQIFYRDGVFYFICLSALATANLAMNLAAPNPAMKLILIQTEVDIHVILATRMLLHLRLWADKEVRANRGTATTDALAYSSTVGDLPPMIFAARQEKNIRSADHSSQLPENRTQSWESDTRADGASSSSRLGV